MRPWKALALCVVLAVAAVALLIWDSFEAKRGSDRP